MKAAADPGRRELGTYLFRRTGRHRRAERRGGTGWTLSGERRRQIKARQAIRFARRGGAVAHELASA